MFNNYFDSIISTGKKSIGFVLFVVCSFAIYKSTLVNENWAQLGLLFRTKLFTITFYQWLVLCLLLFLNFFIESIKWKLVVSNSHLISYANAFKSVMVGQSFAFFTPNRIGDFAGRVMFLKKEHKLVGMAHLAWASYAQLLITLILGIIAINFNFPSFTWSHFIWFNMIKWLSPLIGLLLLVLFFYHKNWEGKLHFLNIVQISVSSKAYLLMFSFFRYGVFILQYLWVAYLLHMEVSFGLLVVSIAILFLCLSILPTINFTELVVRGQLLILILSPIYADKQMIIFLTSFIWCVNFLIPSIIGSILLLGYRLNR
jgi:hypothetical protein